MVTKTSEKVLEQVREMNERYKAKAIQDMVVKALGRMIDPVYFGNAVVMTLRETPKLALCDPATFLGAIIECAQLGLIPGNALKQAHVIPYKQRATLVLGYRGLTTLSYRAGCKLVYADCVHEGDHFEYGQGTGVHNYISHRPADDRDDDNPEGVTHAWAKIVTPQDGEIFKVMSRVKLDQIKKNSPGGNIPDAAWNTHTNSMRQKSPLRFVVDKFAPSDPQLARAAILDDLGEQGMNQNLGDNLAGMFGQVDVPDDPPPPNGNGKTHNGKEKIKDKLRQNGHAAQQNGTAAHNSKEDEQPPPACPPGDSFDPPPLRTPRNSSTKNSTPSLISGVPEKSRNEMTFDSAMHWYIDEKQSSVKDLEKKTGIDVSQLQSYLAGDSLPGQQAVKLLGTALNLRDEDREFLTALAYVAEDGDMPSQVGHDEQGQLI